MGEPRDVTVWTVGHSTRAIGEFVALLRRGGVAVLVDVRRFPSSRRWPQFNGAALEASLREVGIAYRHAPELGGRRQARPDSRNTGWSDGGFRGYADYMETPAFGAALAELMDGAQQHATAIMCAERDWRECHRGLIADALEHRGVRVLHLGVTPGEGEPERHPMTRAARVVGGRLTYEGEAGLWEGV